MIETKEYSVKELANKLGKNERTIRDWCANKKLKLAYKKTPTSPWIIPYADNEIEKFTKDEANERI